MKSLIACYQNGLTFNIAKAVFENNTKRYDRLVAKLHEPDRAGFVRFNAFAIDYNRYLNKISIIKIAFLRRAFDQNQSKIEKMTENRAGFLHLGVIL